MPKALTAPNGTIDLFASDLDPETGELDLKVGDTVYFTYDPLYPEDPPYQLEEICHVTAVSGRTVCFDNTLPHGGPAVVRSYTPGPFNIEATVNDTLTFIIDGSNIYVGLTAGEAVAAETVAANINTAFGAAGLAATADVTGDGCVRVTSTRPIGEGEINVYGGTGMGAIGLPLGV